MPLQAPEDGRLFPPYRVLDLSGPEAVFCGKLLADYGADVVRVEPPGGDPSRSFGPLAQDQEGTERSLYFLFYNTNKRSITLDIQTERGRELFRRLVVEADVIVESYPVGYLDSLGLGYESLREINPGIVMASVTPFGQTGPWSGYRSNDLIALAASGFMQITGEPDGPPSKFGASIGDITAGMLAAQGVLLSLYHREKTGVGQVVDVGMLDGQVALLTYHANNYFGTGKLPPRRGNKHPSITPYETYKCKDGYFNLGVGNDSLWRRFCDAMGLEHIKEDPKFAINKDRVDNRLELQEILDPFFAEKTVGETIETLRGAGIPCGPINNLEQVLNEPQILAREMVVDIDVPVAGPTKVTGVPIKLSETPGAVRTPPPTLGQHTEEVLESVLGMDEAQRNVLREEGVV